MIDQRALKHTETKAAYGQNLIQDRQQARGSQKNNQEELTHDVYLLNA